MTSADQQPQVTSSAGRLSEVQQRALVDWVQRAYKTSRSARAARERQWYLNLAFYGGRQNVEFYRQATSPLGVRLRVPDAPPWRVRLVINRIRPIIRKEAAKLTSNKPQFVAVPATSDDADLAASRAAEKLLDSIWEDVELARVVREAVWWATICGTSFVKDWWDRSCGPKDPQTNKPQGDIKAQAVDPWHLMVPDLRERELEGQPYVIHATTHTRQWVEYALGKKVAEKATVAATEAIMEDVLSGPLAPKPTAQVLCLEAWIKPGAHRNLPQGGMVTVAGDQLVNLVDYAEDGPVFDHGEIPFSKLDHIMLDGFYSDSTITDLVPLQRELNRTRSQLVEAKNMTGKPKFQAPEGSIDAPAVTSEPGQIIFYRPGLGGKLEPLVTPGVPPYVIESVQQIQSDLDDVSGQHQISRGFAPSHTAAAAIAYLQEQDDTLLSYTTSSLEGMVARVGSHCLSHVRQFWTGPRLIRTVGADGTFDAMQFAVSDLRGVTDVRVQAGSALPTSKAARVATLMDMYSKGVFGAPGVPNPNGGPDAGVKLLSAMDLGGLDRAMEDWMVDRRQVDRENILMSRGMQVQVNAFDNHMAHVAGHQRFQKGEQYAALPPELQVLYAMHVAEHQAQQAAMEQMAMAQAGGPPPPGGPQGLPSPPGGPAGGPPPLGLPAGPPNSGPPPPGQR